MAAGDLIVLGWDGSPIFKEVIAPALSYEPSRRNDSNDVVKKTLKRVLHCRKVDVQTVLQALTAQNAVITYDMPNNGGGTTAIGYGGGWKLKRYEEAANLGGQNYFTELNLSYEKEGVTAFELGLPTDLTMTGSGGVGYIKYDGNILLQFNSETDDYGSEWGISEFPAFSNTTYKQVVVHSSTGGSSFPSAINEDVPGVAITFNGKTVKRIIPTKTDYSNLGLLLDGTYCESVFENAVKDDDGNIVTEGYSRFSSTPYTYVDFDSIYKGLRWQVSGTVIKLLFWEITVFEWDIAGL